MQGDEVRGMRLLDEPLGVVEQDIRAKQILDTAQANVAGVVLNGLEATRRHYYYYYYYYEDSASRRRRRWIHLG